MPNAPLQSALTVGTTAVPLTAYDAPLSGLKCKAALGNSDNVYIGFSPEVTAATGWPLDAGQELVISPAVAAFTSTIYVIGGAASQILLWFMAAPDVVEGITPALDFTIPYDSGYIALI